MSTRVLLKDVSSNARDDKGPIELGDGCNAHKDSEGAKQDPQQSHRFRCGRLAETPDTGESGEAYEVEMETMKRRRGMRLQRKDWTGQPPYAERLSMARDRVRYAIPVCQNCGVHCSICRGLKQGYPNLPQLCCLNAESLIFNTKQAEKP
jgi:hypothetical protein